MPDIEPTPEFKQTLQAAFTQAQAPDAGPVATSGPAAMPPVAGGTPPRAPLGGLPGVAPTDQVEPGIGALPPTPRPAMLPIPRLVPPAIPQAPAPMAPAPAVRRPRTMGELVTLLQQHGRFAEANQLVTMMQHQQQAAQKEREATALAQAGQIHQSIGQLESVHPDKQAISPALQQLRAAQAKHLMAAGKPEQAIALQKAPYDIAHTQAQTAEIQHKMGRPDYGFGDEMDAQIYADWGNELTGGKRPTPAMVAVSQQNQFNKKLRMSREQGAIGAERQAQATLARLRAEKLWKDQQTLVEVDPEGSRQYIDRTTGEPVKQSEQFKNILTDVGTGRVVRLQKDEQNQLTSIKQAVPTLAAIREQIEKIYGKGGIFERLTATGRITTATVKGWIGRNLQTDPELAATVRSIKGNVEKLGRALNGARGAQTEGDVSRTRDLLPQLEGIPDSAETAHLLMDQITDLTNSTMGSILGNREFQHPQLQKTPRQEITSLRSMSPEQILTLGDSTLDALTEKDLQGLKPEQLRALQLRNHRRKQGKKP